MDSEKVALGCWSCKEKAITHSAKERRTDRWILFELFVVKDHLWDAVSGVRYGGVSVMVFKCNLLVSLFSLGHLATLCVCCYKGVLQGHFAK